MIATRPCVSELTFLHYSKPIHPEFFRLVATRAVERSNYTICLHLTSTGHVAELQTNVNNAKRYSMTEAVTSAHIEMPDAPISALRFSGQQHETFRISEKFEVATTFGLETLDRKTFLAIQSELVRANGGIQTKTPCNNEMDGLFFHFGSNGRIAFGGLSYLTLETRQQRVRIRAYHTFPENCRVLTTDTTVRVQ